MTMIDALVEYAWWSPMTALEAELLLVAWAAAARHQRADAVWAAVEEHAEQWRSCDGVRATA